MKKILIISTTLIVVIALFIRMCDDNNYGANEMIIDTDTSNVEFKGRSLEIKDNPDNNDSVTLIPIENEITIDSSDICLARLIHSKPEQILRREGYITSYNCHTKNANWVSWHLTKEHTTGPWPRLNYYIVDNSIKTGQRQELEDWYEHGLPIDHGHLCPAGDNKWSEKAMEQTFLLSNICPQNSNLNRGDWEKLENRCRGWANHYGDIYIVTGPVFYSESYQTIGRNKVGVPDAFFKVILCMNKKPKALGFIYPNDGNHHRMEYYVRSVDEVEAITAIDFFFNLPDDIESSIESSSSFNSW